MDWRKEGRANLVAILALLAGPAAFFVAFYALQVVALYAGLIKLRGINLVFEPLPWVMPTIVGISILFATFVVSWIRRLKRSGSMFSAK
jgi:hypothetical protein